MRSALSTLLELAGLAAVAVGLSLVAPWLGWIGAGAGLVLLGLAVDRS